jgi:hypothetical protein
VTADSPGKNYAAQAAIRGAEAPFQRFLSDCVKTPVATPEDAAQAIRKLCGITTRAQLNSDPQAIERWHRVLTWFGKWRAGHGKNAVGRPYGPSIMGRVAHDRGMALSDNPFPQPDPFDTDESDYDLWAIGWQKGARALKEAAATRA